MKRTSIAFVTVCLMSILNLFGQQPTPLVDQMDLSAVSTGILLNKGFAREKYLDQFRNARMDGKFRVFQCTPEAWKTLYESISNSEINTKRLKDFSNYVPEDSDAQHAMGTVPVGLLNFTGQYLTTDQIKENIKQKAKGKKADGSGYEKVRIVAVAPIRQNLYSGEVTLDFSDRFRFGNNNEPLEDLAVDFRDGKGFQKIESSNSRMTHRFATPGSKILTFRYTIGGTNYQSHSELQIRTVEPYPFDKTFKVTAQPVIGENAGGRTINGATVAVMLGCDKVFDKPIIIVEGFDYNNGRGINTIANNYLQNYSNGTAFGVFGRLLSHGYDMVIVNFNDATDYIQNNANVLINVIQAVNWDKTGYAPNMVIGESNGGIIARYALRKMEQQSMTHNVNYFVSFDSPQKGANVPEGVIHLLQQVRATGIVLVDNFIDWLVPGDYSAFGLTDFKALLKASNSPAARQVLFRYLSSGGQIEQSVLFSNLQNELNGMGYPQNCINLAVVNGSIFNNGQTTRTYGAAETQGMEMYNGEQVQDVFSFHAIAKTTIINTNFEIAWFHIYLFANPGPYDYSAYLNSPLNRDLCPGSYQDQVAQLGGRNFRFSFVPTYSAIGYSGSINSDSDQYLSNAASASSPFNKIYGDGINSEHINVNQEEAAWTSLFSEKLGINGYASSCPAPSAYYGPVPVFNSPSVICLNDVYTFDASGTGFAGQNLSYSWKIKIMFGPNADQVVATGSSSTYSMYGANYATGDYEIVCKAYYPGHEAEGFESSRTVYVDRSCDHSSGRRPSTSEPETETVFAVTPNPATNKATVRLRIRDGLTGNICVTAINGKSIFQRSVIGSGLEQQTDLNVSTLSPGIYMISLEAGRIKESQKLIVTR